jgi:putative CocE/NonD family hydrolase
MSVATRYVARHFGLPPAVTENVAVDRDIDVVARDGVRLRTDHYAPDLDRAPTILIRTPYGRGGPFGLVTGRLFAERGFHVVLQSCRGTFDSGGDFAPMRHERTDGLDTLAWLEGQPWFDGTVFTWGASYIGFTQWALATDAGPALRGMLTAVTASSFRDPTYAGGSFSLDTVLNWATLLNNQGGSMLTFLIKQTRTQRLLRRAWTHLPLAEADAIAAGREIAFFQEWLISAGDEPYWRERGQDGRIECTDAAVCMVGGWYDIFLPWQLADYARLRAAGKRPRLIIGPWTHASRDLFARTMREGVNWFRSRLATDEPGGAEAPPPVEIYVGGADEWRTLEDWPPSGRTREWVARADGGLADAADRARGADAAIARFRYDPADPTPSPGGPLLTTGAGRVRNNAVEARADTLVFSTPALVEPVEAIGPVTVSVRVRSSSPYFDMFARVCDVSPEGRSENVCDGLTRVSGGVAAEDDGTRTVEVTLWPTAYRWRSGHRIRLQLAGGAHPRYARNPGTGEPLGSATRLVAVDHEVLACTVRMTSTG